MKRFEEIKDFDNEFRSMDKKINMDEKEKGEILSIINEKIDRDKRTTRWWSAEWKYYLSITTALFIIFILSFPILSDVTNNKTGDIGEKNHLDDLGAYKQILAFILAKDALHLWFLGIILTILFLITWLFLRRTMNIMKKISGILGSIAGVSSIVLWLVLVFFNPYTSPLEVSTTLITFIMLFLPACLAIFASYQLQSNKMLIAFIWSLPISIYLAMTPGIFALFGMTSIVYLISFMIMRFGLRNGL